MVDVRRLRVLCEVARQGSLTAAARALAYSPSAVSQQITMLEREVDAVLLERVHRGVVLTDAGRVLVQEAEEIFVRLAAAESAVQAIAGLGSGLLRLGWFATAGANLMPRAIAEFRRRHPGVALDLFQGDPGECVAQLRAREIHLALVYEFELEPPLGGDLQQIHLVADSLHIGLPRDHPLTARRHVRLADLAQAHWIQGVREGATVDVLPRACRLAGFEPTIVLRTDDRTAVEGLVAAGVGVALMPQITLPTVRPDVVVRPLDSPALTRRVRAALPPGSYRHAAAMAMIDILHEVCAGLVGEAQQRIRGEE
jgi:molybdate transport repressor ModE-like protein